MIGHQKSLLPYLVEQSSVGGSPSHPVVYHVISNVSNKEVQGVNADRALDVARHALTERKKTIKRERQRVRRLKLKVNDLRRTISESLDTEDMPNILRHLAGAMQQRQQGTPLLQALLDDMGRNLALSLR
eukprot:GILJ01006482.1.p1 GENE.GILJ01006482.1~~GILJ01006482.1.p1  ORF type:complete len:130 (+),score=12.16 GILJ01006482.1:203-592(+)